MNIHEILSFVDKNSIIKAHSLLNYEILSRFYAWYCSCTHHTLNF